MPARADITAIRQALTNGEILEKLFPTFTWEMDSDYDWSGSSPRVVTDHPDYREGVRDEDPGPFQYWILSTMFVPETEDKSAHYKVAFQRVVGGGEEYGADDDTRIPMLETTAVAIEDIPKAITRGYKDWAATAVTALGLQ